MSRYITIDGKRVFFDGCGSGKLLKRDGDRFVGVEQSADGGAAWGDITGALADQSDLNTALSGKAANDHNHDAAYDAVGSAADALASALAADFSGSYNDLTDKPSLFSGSYNDLSETPTLGDAASKNVGTSAGTVAAGDHTHAGGGAALDAWPVGSVFIAVVSTSPATLLGGGTWSAFGAGRMLVGHNSGDSDFDTAEETGGAKTVTLTAPQSGLPAHRHQIIRERSATTGGATTLIARTSDTSSTADTNVFTENVAAANAAEAHPNMPPYIVVYMWKRTA